MSNLGTNASINSVKNRPLFFTYYLAILELVLLLFWIGSSRPWLYPFQNVCWRMTIRTDKKVFGANHETLLVLFGVNIRMRGARLSGCQCPRQTAMPWHWVRISAPVCINRPGEDNTAGSTILVQHQTSTPTPCAAFQNSAVTVWKTNKQNSAPMYVCHPDVKYCDCQLLTA